MRTYVIAWLLTLLLLGSRARAQDAATTVVVVGGDSTFREALADALVDNRVEAVGELPTPALGELATRSRQLADAHLGVATIWLSAASGGATLVTYERTVDRFLVRELPYALPLSATQAAEAARMVRTMLRALRSADDDAALVAAVRPEPSPPIVEQPLHAFAASLGIGAWFAAPKAYATPLIAMTIAWRPDQLGAALVATLAPAAEIETMSFRGDVRDVVIAGELRRALRVAPTVRITPALGAALHVVSLGGTVAPTEKVESRRFNPGVRGGVVATVDLPHAVDLGLGVSADCLLQRQRYQAGAEQILLVPRLQVMMTAFVGVRL